jgi:hypothetical protein
MLNLRTRLIAAAALAVTSSALIAQDAQQPAAQPAADAQPQQGQPPASQPTVSEPMDFRKLKELLPAEVAGVKRTEATGEKNAFGDFKVSTARGTYAKDQEKDDAPRIDVEISDYAATKGMAEGMAFWTKMEVDRDGDTGYEKTTKVAGQPAMESYQTEGKSGHLQVFVANRYMVQVNTQNVPVEQFKKIGEELKLEKLAALK